MCHVTTTLYTPSDSIACVPRILPNKRALDVLLIMSGLLIVTMIVASFHTPEDEKDKAVQGTKTHQILHKEFDSFRHQYITVYGIIMLADWMQGTHMYTLYLSYGVNISALFLTGFLSGAVFAPFLGSAVDKFGRKRACLVYCVLEVMINVMEHSTHFPTLIAGRILGGISTNLLFSAFESWMTTEHRKRGFPEEWLTRTYSEASMVNGSTAVLAGIVAQVLEDSLGQIGPFQGAIGLTVLALVLVLRWEENYGEEEKKEGDNTDASVYTQFIDGWATTIADSRVWRIGMTQALSEGAMYTVSVFRYTVNVPRVADL
jgi:MFS transporter, MFS domain-containing protein family, molybdate-anion transporter